ncbi:hypothetical protein CP083_05220 [Candidatus Bathyarchaeota archaeon B24-2]|nr:MAG: hypothetical protein CP083_05220 [Candidatus Bathyarchaeota archaeon B24-2]
MALRYGTTTQTIKIPSRNLVCVAKSHSLPSISDEESMITETLNRPIGSPTLEEIVSPNRKVAVIFDDYTRFTPTHKILPFILKRLEKAGVRKENLSLVMATGAHKRPTPEQIKKKVGDEVLETYKVYVHDCLDKDELVLLGFSSFGTPVWINRRVAEADVKIAVGGVKPHPWAGFGGGAKILLPGVSAWEAIGRNHTLTISDNARYGRIEGNPVRKDIEEVAKKVGLDIVINTVLDDEKRVVDVVAGDFIEAHRKAVETSRKLFENKLKEEVDILIIAFGPRDDNLWNVLTGKFAGVKKILKDGGTLILVAACPDGVYKYGIGHVDYTGKVADYSGLIELLKSGVGPEEVLSEAIRGKVPYLEVGVKAYLLARLAKTKDVVIVSQGLKEEDVSWLGKLTNSAQEALDEALETQGGDAEIAVLPDFNVSNAYLITPL